MPGYDTHFVFGEVAFKQIKASSVKSIIANNHDHYTLGLFGPDIFFYSIPESLSSGPNAGSVIHTQNVNLFFRNMFRFATAQPNEERMQKALAYFCGFLAHYSLDRYCHPFVYARTGYNPNLPKKDNNLDLHFALETDIDILLLDRYLKETPKSFKKKSRINITYAEIELISEMLQFAINQTYDQFSNSRFSIKAAILSIKSEQRLIKSCPDIVRYYVEQAENKVIGRHYISALIPGNGVISTSDPFNDRHDIWTNPWKSDEIHTESFPMLMDKAKSKVLELYDLLEDAIIECPDPAEYSAFSSAAEDFLSAIGNYSYHSNLDVNV